MKPLEPARPAASRRRRAPWLMLLFGFAVIALNGWLRAAGSLAQWDWLVTARVSPGPLYLLLSGVLWGAVGLAAVVWTAFRLPRWRQAGLALALVIALTYWLDRIFFRNPETSLPNTAFSILFTLLALVFTLLALYPLSEVWPGAPRLRR